LLSSHPNAPPSRPNPGANCNAAYAEPVSSAYSLSIGKLVLSQNALAEATEPMPTATTATPASSRRGRSSTSFCASSHESKSANCVRNGTSTRPVAGTTEAASTASPSAARFSCTPRSAVSAGLDADASTDAPEAAAATRRAGRADARRAEEARRRHAGAVVAEATVRQLIIDKSRHKLCPRGRTSVVVLWTAASWSFGRSVH
jgi:hypothetical protein